MTTELVLPCLSRGLIHLPGVRLAHHHREIPREPHRLVAGQISDVELQILRQQFPHEHRTIEHLGRHHPVAEGWGEVPRPGHHPLTVIGRHLNLGIVGRQRGHGLLDINQADLALLATDRDEHRGAKEAE